MRFISAISILLFHASLALTSLQIPVAQQDASDNRAISPQLFSELEELARIVDITYCVGLTSIGISKPFNCLSRCSAFPNFELVKTWNTGPLMSDSCGYLALDHSIAHPRIIVAFRGSYSIANAIVDLSTVPQEYIPYPGDPEDSLDQHVQQRVGIKGETPRCDNCTVHFGFYQSWRVTSKTIRPELERLVTTHPSYKLHLVGHSLGGAVAALAALDFQSLGWKPTITTFGEPRLGNQGLTNYIDTMFKLNQSTSVPRLDAKSLQAYEDSLSFRRVTHVDDPVPQLPLSEWGFRMHAGEIFITKPELSPDIQDMQHCFGDQDPLCIAGQDGSLVSSCHTTTKGHDEENNVRTQPKEPIADVVKAAGLWGSNGGGITIPARYKLWQMLFAHRDYFWRLGLCVPGGNPWGWGQLPRDNDKNDGFDDPDDQNPVGNGV